MEREAKEVFLKNLVVDAAQDVCCMDFDRDMVVCTAVKLGYLSVDEIVEAFRVRLGIEVRMCE